MDTWSKMYPSPEYLDAYGNKMGAQGGISQRLAIATQLLGNMFRTTPFEVTDRKQLVEEAYRYADLLMELQYVEPKKF